MLAGLSDVWESRPATWAEFVQRYPGYPLMLAEQRPGVPLARALGSPAMGKPELLDSLLATNPGSAYSALPRPLQAPIDEEVRLPRAVAEECWRTGRPHLFAGSRGAQSLLQVDADYSHGLHLVAAGEQRVFFFPPGAAPHLQPELDLSSLPFHQWGLEQRRALAERAGGLEAVVAAGEAYYVPKSWWHQVELLDHSVGLLWRFGRSPAQNLLALLVRQPIMEVVQLSETLESGRAGILRWAVELLEVLTTRAEPLEAHARLVNFLERSHQRRVPPQLRHRSWLNGAEGFEALRKLTPQPGVRSALRIRNTPAFDFLDPHLSLETLRYVASWTLGEEVRDPVAARADFVLDLWPWPEVPADEAALRLTIAGLRDPGPFG